MATAKKTVSAKTVKPAEEKKEVKPVNVECKSVTLKFNRCVITDDAEFYPGDVKEVSEKLANILLKIKGVEKC